MSFLHPEVPVGHRIGSIALVGAGPGAADLLTLRALDRLRNADVVFYDRLVDPAVLDLVAAEKIFVGKEVGACSWPQARINAVIVAAALAGRSVVRLKSGDPSIFGRAAEELEAARLAGVPVELVPGITAASAAAASLGRPLTERGRTERLIIATATSQTGGIARVADGFAAGTTLALYMAVHRRAEVCLALIAAGAPEFCAVEVVHAASLHAEAQWSGTLAELASSDADFRNPAIILVHWESVAACPAASPDMQVPLPYPCA